MLKVLSRVDKQAGNERKRIERLVYKQEASIRAAFRTYLDSVTSSRAVKRVLRVLETRGVEAALEIVDTHIARLSNITSRVFQDVGNAEAIALSNQLGPEIGVAISFNPTSPRAAEIMRRNRLEFVREFTSNQRDATRQALTEALQSGQGPVQTARSFRESIGLTVFQRNVVESFRRLLEQGDRRALQRELRDRRFDPSIRESVETKTPLGPRKIQRMVERYRQRYLQFRAETIARTETVRVLNQARDEGLRQTMQQAEIPPDMVSRVWLATQDLRTRDTHASMHEQVRGINEPFISPSGAQLMFPGDPGAPAAEVINCRCVLAVRIAEEE